jgi:2-(1,2-epoxy-1,2-dihydrophenyl)acetyl-CoA isomerase
MFLVDNERWKRLPVRIGQHVITANQSGVNGHFTGEFRQVLREGKMSALIEVTSEGHIAQVVLNRPAAYNAFNYETVSQLGEHLTALAADENVRAVVISGRGKAFCAGGDLKWALGNSTRPAAAFHRLAAQFHLAILEIRRMRKPVVAAINGVAAGGGFSLALACDFRIMEKSAVLRQAYTSSGLCIDGGGTFTLPRLVGYARALEIAAFDEPIPSDRALEWSLVTKVVEDGRSLVEACEMAKKIARGSLNSYGWCKKLITDSFNTSFETQIENERAALEACADHSDGLEGLKAFSEKRKPNYSAL